MSAEKERNSGPNRTPRVSKPPATSHPAASPSEVPQEVKVVPDITTQCGLQKEWGKGKRRTECSNLLSASTISVAHRIPAYTASPPGGVRKHRCEAMRSAWTCKSGQYPRWGLPHSSGRQPTFSPFLSPSPVPAMHYRAASGWMLRPHRLNAPLSCNTLAGEGGIFLLSFKIAWNFIFSARLLMKRSRK